MNTQDAIKKTGDFIRNSATLKIISIGILILLLLIPANQKTVTMNKIPYYT